MKVLVKTNSLTREEWLKYRTQGIGGSDVSVIAGINPYRSVYQLWLEKTGQIEPEEGDNEYILWGNIMEPIIRKEFTRRTNIRVRQRHVLLQSEQHPFMLADLDGVINEDGELVVFEAKTASAYKLDLWENEVPAEYMLQLQHYMAVTGAKRSYIAALVGGNHFLYHKVERDDEMIGKIITMEKYFWEHHVMEGVEPVPDGSKATTEYFNSRFGTSNGDTVELPEEAILVCDQYERLSQEIKKLEAEKDAAGNRLKNYLKDAEAGVCGERRVVWKSVVKNSVDTKKLKQEQPEIYQAYLSQSSYRKLSVA